MNYVGEQTVAASKEVHSYIMSQVIQRKGSASLVDVVASSEAAGFIAIEAKGFNRFQVPLRRRVLRAVLESSDGHRALVRIEGDLGLEHRLFDAETLSMCSIAEAGQMFEIVVAEQVAEGGTRSSVVSYCPTGDPRLRRSESLLTAADAAEFAKMV
ncbi:MAG: hypothetical protein AABZ53_06175 [Planctomycetota bacterium]